MDSTIWYCIGCLTAYLLGLAIYAYIHSGRTVKRHMEEYGHDNRLFKGDRK